jgi:hypothetical protein
MLKYADILLKLWYDCSLVQGKFGDFTVCGAGFEDINLLPNGNQR